MEQHCTVFMDAPAVENPSGFPVNDPRSLEHSHSESSAPLQTAGASPAKVQRLIIDGNGSNWHQSSIIAVHQDKERSSLDSLPVLDFDLLCATVAMQREPLSVEIQRDASEGGVQRMWEGGVLNCFDDTGIAVQTLCCPCVTHGNNLHRAGFGSCLSKGGIHFLLLASSFISYIFFLCAYGVLFLYLSLVLLISIATYGSYYRIQIRRKFNIKGTDSDGVVSALDDSLNHFVCGCCTLCQEARTLEMNNVQDGNWHGRGDTIWVGSYAMPESHEVPSTETTQPVVVTISAETHSQEAGGHSWEQGQESCQPLMEHNHQAKASHGG